MRKPSPIADVVMHPVRLRIIQQVGTREVTTASLRSALPDVAQATLYRHIAALVDADVLAVVEERRVRGAVERTFALGERMAHVDHDELLEMGARELQQAFLDLPRPSRRELRPGECGRRSAVPRLPRVRRDDPACDDRRSHRDPGRTRRAPRALPGRRRRRPPRGHARHGTHPVRQGPTARLNRATSGRCCVHGLIPAEARRARLPWSAAVAGARTRWSAAATR